MKPQSKRPTKDALKILSFRIEVATDSAITAAISAHLEGHEQLAGKLSLMSVTLVAMTERVSAMIEKMENTKDETKTTTPTGPEAATQHQH